MAQRTDTRPVRQGEELDTKAIETYVRSHLEVPAGELTVRQFGAGHSNLTYELSIGNWKAVLRRPPLGPVAPKAHDMEREYKVLQSLNPVFPLAPKPLLFNDGDVIGVPFFIMERRSGFVYDTEFPEEVQPTAALGQQISEEMVDRLVELHAIDYKKTELAEMVKPEGFMERQVHGWIKRYEQARTDDVVSGERLKRWLIDHIPDSSEAAIIHYDYKLNNAMFHEDNPTEMVGLFDWEMTTVGDPLADLGAAMSYWMEADDPELLRTGLGKPPVTVMEGFYTREQFLRRYAEKSGRDLSDIHFYVTFAYFKLVGIVQQIYARYKKGQTQDPRFAHMHVFVNALMEHAEKQQAFPMGKIEVIFKKENIDPASMKGKIAVVFDVLFATSTITAALADGAKGVFPVLDHVQAREKAKTMEHPYILAGEDHGKLIEGFHPPLRTYLKSVIQDQHVILSTTNGTVALQRSSQADALYACSLLNNKAMANHLNGTHAGETLTLVCSGSSRHYTLEDFFGAGSLIHYLLEGGHWELSDGAQTALLFYNGNKLPISDLLSKAKIGRLLIGAGMDPQEIAFVSQEGLWETIPFYDSDEGKIKEWKHELS